MAEGAEAAAGAVEGIGAGTRAGAPLGGEMGHDLAWCWRSTGLGCPILGRGSVEEEAAVDDVERCVELFGEWGPVAGRVPVLHGGDQ